MRSGGFNVEMVFDHPPSQNGFRFEFLFKTRNMEDKMNVYSRRSFNDFTYPILCRA